VTTCVDSSALVPIYVPERFLRTARSVIPTIGPIPFTAMHRLEVINAFEQLVGRGVITRDECEAVTAQLKDDVETLRLLPVAVDLDRVFVEASELSRLHTARARSRSLDRLHVAAARVMPCTSFVSADDRQLAVAKRSGLVPMDIKRRSPRRPS
jgi:predicted nucleic acid-binding protein